MKPGCNRVTGKSPTLYLCCAPHYQSVLSLLYYYYMSYI